MLPLLNETCIVLIWECEKIQDSSNNSDTFPAYGWNPTRLDRSLHGCCFTLLLTGVQPCNSPDWHLLLVLVVLAYLRSPKPRLLGRFYRNEGISTWRWPNPCFLVGSYKITISPGDPGFLNHSDSGWNFQRIKVTEFLTFQATPAPEEVAEKDRYVPLVLFSLKMLTI